MGVLQKIKIIESVEDLPIIGNQVEPNTIFVHPITDKVCDTYLSDNNGIVRATSVQTPVYNSVEEANAGVPKGNRFENKTVLIKRLFQKDDTTKATYTEYWWKDGTNDENLSIKSFSLSAVLSNGNELPAGQTIVFVGGKEPNVPPEFFPEGDINTISIGVGSDGTNFLANSQMPFLDSEAFFYQNTSIGNDSFKSIEGGWSNIAIGPSSLDKAKWCSASVALGSGTLGDFKGESNIYSQGYGQPWGKITPNIAIGYWAGRGLKEGRGNIYIGSAVASRPNTESNQLAIHCSGNEIGSGSDLPTNARYPLIRGDFGKRWFQIAGKYRFNKTQNPTHTDFENVDEMVAVSNIENESYKEMKTVKSTDYILKQIKSMTEEQKLELKTALGIA